MLISELIAKLATIIAEHEDMPVRVMAPQWGGYSAEEEEIELDIEDADHRPRRLVIRDPY